MFKIQTAAENAIIIYFGNKIEPEMPQKLQFFSHFLKQQFASIIIDITPSYTTLHLIYDIGLIDNAQFFDQLMRCLENTQYNPSVSHRKLIKIPVYYAFDSGLDLQRLMTEKQLGLTEFIDIHSRTEYLVYAIGFSPMFAFLGQVDERIQAPRLSTPRIHISAGSVGIADTQTAVYPAHSSGGWNIIGRTPIDLSLNNPKNIDKFSIGDTVKFEPITHKQFVKLGGVL